MFSLPKINQQKSIVELKCVTWQKDSHGLFDYESKSIEVQKHKIDTPSQILRNNQQKISVEETDDNREVGQNNQMLTEIIQIKDKYYIKPSHSFKEQAYLPNIDKKEGERQDQETFLIVRSLKGKEGQQTGYQLKLNDILKVGRIEYQVVELKSHGIVKRIQEQFAQKDKFIYNIDYNQQQKRTCKICLVDEEQTEENPFISPCNCKGSCEYVHFQCLKYWVQSKIQKKQSQNKNLLSFKWKKLECELCQVPLPKVIEINNQQEELVEIERPESDNYIIIEQVNRDKKFSKGLYIIKEGEEPGEVLGKMGRGHQCDIRISDISVSRYHAYVMFKNGKFSLYDNNSKFGTLIKLQESFQITEDKMAIQVGRTVITFVNKPQGNQQQQQQERQSTQFLTQQSSNIGNMPSSHHPSFPIQQLAIQQQFNKGSSIGNNNNRENQYQFTSSNAYQQQSQAMPNQPVLMTSQVQKQKGDMRNIMQKTFTQQTTSFQ